ncbi:MAG: hypothetical protein RIM84_18615 [Alphaproteobacteria bacterium]
MISEATSLVEAIFKTLRINEEDRKNYFLSHVDPLFEQLKDINSDFMESLTAISHKLSDSESINDVARFIESQRNNYRSERMEAYNSAIAELRKVRGRSLRGRHQFELESFFEEIERYFQLDQVYMHEYKALHEALMHRIILCQRMEKPRGRDTSSSVEDRIASNRRDVSSLGEEIVRLVEDLREARARRWNSICLSYATVKSILVNI